MSTCLARPCTSLERARGLCDKHYTAARVAGLLGPASFGGCHAHACEGRPLARGWCRRHYNQVRKHGRPTPEREHRPAGARCSRPGCRNRPCTRGRCQTHYHAWWKHEGGWRVVMKVAKKRRVA